MSEKIEHITAEEISQYGVVAAPDVLNGTPGDNKAIFDRLVRDLVVVSVNLVIDRLNGLMDVETVREEQELGRQEAEASRVTAEEARQTAEQGRETAEGARSEAEAERVSAENERLQAEAVRETAEGERGEAEQGRVTAEQSRAAAEQERVSAEEERILAEAARKAAEAAREAEENRRKGAEQSRAEAEAARAAAEQERVSAENERLQAEAARKASEEERSEAEQGRVTAEQSRTAAEEARDQAEGERVSAEQERVSAENERLQAEAARKAAEEGRGEAEQGRETAEQSRAEAEVARDQAEGERVAAEQLRVSETEGVVARAGAKADAAQAAAVQAADSAAQVQTLAQGVGAAAQEAQESRDAAAWSAQSAKASKEEAKQWAERAEEVAGGDFATEGYVKTAVSEHAGDPEAHKALLEAKQDKITAAGLLKGDGAGGVVAAVPGEDYNVQGEDGEDGVTPDVQVGTVTTLPAGSAAQVTRREGSPDAAPVFDFWIPKGADGKSAYQSAVEAGYTGTEAEFYSMLSSGPWVKSKGTAELVSGKIKISDYDVNIARITIKDDSSTEEGHINIKRYFGTDYVSVLGIAPPLSDYAAVNKKYVDEKFAQVAPIIVTVITYNRTGAVANSYNVKCYPMATGIGAYSINFTFPVKEFSDGLTEVIRIYPPAQYAFTSLYASFGVVMEYTGFGNNNPSSYSRFGCLSEDDGCISFSTSSIISSNVCIKGGLTLEVA